MYWNRYTWNAPAQITYPGGATRHIAHDPLLRIRQITARDPAANAVLDYRYRYDPVGNILEKATEHGTYAYEYDPRDRLTCATNPTLPDEAYGYDPAGNRTSDANLPGPWQYDDANALQNYAGITLEQDANGSTIRKTGSGQTTTYIYNLENRLSEVRDTSGATVARYGYDPFGRRIWKETGGVRTYFVYSEEGLVAELDASGNLIQGYGYVPQSTYGTAPLYTRTPTGYAYYQLDQLGTPQLLTDKSGRIVWQGRAMAFGSTTEIVNEIRNPLRFPGQYYDEETGLHYNYFRYYDPEIGRYIMSDPIGLWGELNVYNYTLMNPVNYIDYSGLDVLVLNCTEPVTNPNNLNSHIQGGTLTYYRDDGTIEYRGSYRSGTRGVFDESVVERGPLPTGIYKIEQENENYKLKAFCDKEGNCWFSPLVPVTVMPNGHCPNTLPDRCGIHPQGGAFGTLGCAGLTDKSTKTLEDLINNAHPSPTKPLWVKVVCY